MGGVGRREDLVLVVDDEMTVREVAHELLETAGYEIIEAEDAASALDVLGRRSDIGIVFSDVQMPGMDGLELARVVRRTWPQVLLLLTSGKIRPRPDEIVEDGKFLAKPYRLADVLKALDDLKSEARSRGPMR